MLRDRDIAMCVIEQPDFQCPVVSTASWGYLRLHKLDYDQSRARASGRNALSAQEWNEAFVYFKHDEGDGIGAACGRSICPIYRA